jgi:dolichol kinase
MAVALGCVLLTEVVLPARYLWIAPFGIAALCWSLEAARHCSRRARAIFLHVVRAIAHPHERHRINSSTWFASGLALLAFTLDPMLCAVAVAVLGFADPAASLVGRRFGRTRLLQQRSLEGSLAFVAVGAAVSLVVLAIWHHDVAWTSRLALALGAAVLGAVAELISGGPIDDNLSVPVGAGLGGLVALTIML